MVTGHLVDLDIPAIWRPAVVFPDPFFAAIEHAVVSEDVGSVLLGAEQHERAIVRLDRVAGKGVTERLLDRLVLKLIGRVCRFLGIRGESLLELGDFPGETVARPL